VFWSTNKGTMQVTLAAGPRINFTGVGIFCWYRRLTKLKVPLISAVWTKSSSLPEVTTNLLATAYFEEQSPEDWQ
jgi:hypothetical protein